MSQRCLEMQAARMKKLRKISIVAVRERSLVVRTANSTDLAWCPVCHTSGLMVSPASAAAASMQSIRTIYRWVEAGKLHYTEEPAGLLICLASLRLENVEK
jgi:hypothetical protein